MMRKLAVAAALLSGCAAEPAQYIYLKNSQGQQVQCGPIGGGGLMIGARFRPRRTASRRIAISSDARLRGGLPAPRIRADSIPAEAGGNLVAALPSL